MNTHISSLASADAGVHASAFAAPLRKPIDCHIVSGDDATPPDITISEARRVQYAYYFERDGARSHLSLVEWHAAVAVVPGVRPVASPLEGLGDWVGYWVNPRGTPGREFHDMPDRADDTEVYFPQEGRWRRAFYWHRLPESGFGVVTFEDGPASVPRDEQPVWVAARALAALLGADLVGEDDTAYEQ